MEQHPLICYPALLKFVDLLSVNSKPAISLRILLPYISSLPPHNARHYAA